MLLLTGGSEGGNDCNNEYIPALLFAVSSVFPFLSFTSNIIDSGHISYNINSDKRIYLFFHTYLTIFGHDFIGNIL